MLKDIPFGTVGTKQEKDLLPNLMKNRERSSDVGMSTVS